MTAMATGGSLSQAAETTLATTITDKNKTQKKANNRNRARNQTTAPKTILARPMGKRVRSRSKRSKIWKRTKQPGKTLRKATKQKVMKVAKHKLTKRGAKMKSKMI